MALRGLTFICGFLLLASLKLSDGLQCYSCDSGADENCATLQQNTTAIECADNCAVWIEGFDTFRGCESDIPPQATLSHSCDVNGCNQIIFPSDRIKCVSCSADEDFCTTPDADLLYPCRNFAANDSCYTYVIDERSAIRGCLSDQDENVDLCVSVNGDCIKCSEEFCNLQGGQSFVSCIECSSEDDPSCGYTQENVPQEEEKLCGVLLGRENLCFAFTNSSHFQRGCLNDFPELKPACAENSETCQVCDEDSCNAMKIVEEFCIVCDSSSDPGCGDIGSAHTPALCGEATITKSGCYHADKDGEVRRGCVADLDGDDLAECRDGEVCKICNFNSCNVKATFQKCFACNSLDDPNCATLQGELPERTCDDYYDTCKVYVKPNMTTHRGCFREMLGDGIDCLPLSVNCKQCSDNGCNGEVFPANRLSCFHCEGANTTDECYNNLDGNLELSHPCETYNFRDSCYLYMDSDKAIHRGCMSDQDEYTELCQSSPHCRQCQSSNCNAESVMKEPELSCIFCDTGLNGVECNWGLKASLAKPCEFPIYFFEEETCYTLHSTDQTIRGCTLDGNVCPSSKCTLCNGTDACNRENIAQQFCYECFSDDDANCFSSPSATKNVTCSGVIEYEHRGCYTWIDADKKVKRGCLSDFSVDDRAKCEADKKNCVTCVDEENCNKAPKDSAGFIAVNLMLLFAMFVLSHSM